LTRIKTAGAKKRPAPDQDAAALIQIIAKAAEYSQDEIEQLPPIPSQKRFSMYKHLLIATDGSDLAQKAVEQGLALAKALNAKATIITVTLPWDALIVGDAIAVLPPAEYEENVALTASKILAVGRGAADQLGIPCDTLHVKNRFSAEGILDTAVGKGCDLIVMASHGRRGLRRLILGSIANEVVTQSTVPVLICR
jgi:nucleotide-binding universal stress UspA family protein